MLNFHVYNMKKIESASYYRIFNFNMVIIDFLPEEEKIFNDTIEMFKEIICELLLDSFNQYFVNIENVKLSKFDNNIKKWFSKDIKEKLLELENEMNNDEILTMGFQIKLLLENVYEDSSNELLYDESHNVFGNLILQSKDELRNKFIKDKNYEYLKLTHNLTKLQANYINEIFLKEYLNGN